MFRRMNIRGILGAAVLCLGLVCSAEYSPSLADGGGEPTVTGEVVFVFPASLGNAEVMCWSAAAPWIKLDADEFNIVSAGILAAETVFPNLELESVELAAGGEYACTLEGGQWVFRLTVTALVNAPNTTPGTSRHVFCGPGNPLPATDAGIRTVAPAVGSITRVGNTAQLEIEDPIDVTFIGPVVNHVLSGGTGAAAVMVGNIGPSEVEQGSAGQIADTQPFLRRNPDILFSNAIHGRWLVIDKKGTKQLL